jgi:hypothetical protein
MTSYPGKIPWRAAVSAKLSRLLEGMSSPPDWYSRWCALGPTSSEVDRLQACQAIRDAAVLPPAAGFYLVSWQIDAISNEVAEIELADMEQQLRAIERKHGLQDDEFFLPGEAPDEFEQLRLQCQAAWDGIFLRLLRQHGEPEMAELFETDGDEFERRSDAGRNYFHGSASPDGDTAWMDELAELVAAQMVAETATGPLLVRYGEDDGLWELVIYPSPIELVGGAVDGEVVSPSFSLDLEGLRGVFDEIVAAGWSTGDSPADDGPYVWVEGVFQEHEVVVRVLAYAPDDEQPGLKLDVTKRSQR